MFHTMDYTNLSPREFEVYCLSLVKRAFCKFDSINIDYDVLLRGYQIDICCTHHVHEMEFKTIIECKRYKTPIKRDTVLALHSKVQELGAHKGMLISSSRFQSGAIEFAKEHGIALVQVIDGRLNYHTKNKKFTDDSNPKQPVNLPGSIEPLGVLIGYVSPTITSYHALYEVDPIRDFLAN